MSEMRHRIAKAMVERESGPEGSSLFDIHWDEFGEVYYNSAKSALAAMQIPTNRMVAAAADELGMDATKVAAVWMIMIREACKDG